MPVIVKAVALAVTLFASVSASAPAPAPSSSMSPIPLVTCTSKAKGLYIGSAVRVAPRVLISAHHLTREAPCSIDGAPMTVGFSSARQDYSLITDGREGQYLEIDCRGFQAGRTYIALGHARGIAQLVPVKLVAIGQRTRDGFAILVGIFTTVPGQSGGAIIDPVTGAAVGLINSADFEAGASASMEFKNTRLCAAAPRPKPRERIA